ncbi:UNVERIFIED_CONTAM: hypothetical protein K2H54_013688 [Gekko kuhli]
MGINALRLWNRDKYDEPVSGMFGLKARAILAYLASWAHLETQAHLAPMGPQDLWGLQGILEIQAKKARPDLRDHRGCRDSWARQENPGFQDRKELGGCRVLKDPEEMQGPLAQGERQARLAHQAEKDNQEKMEIPARSGLLDHGGSEGCRCNVDAESKLSLHGIEIQPN